MLHKKCCENVAKQMPHHPERSNENYLLKLLQIIVYKLLYTSFLKVFFCYMNHIASPD